MNSSRVWSIQSHKFSRAAWFRHNHPDPTGDFPILGPYLQPPVALTQNTVLQLLNGNCLLTREERGDFQGNLQGNK